MRFLGTLTQTMASFRSIADSAVLSVEILGVERRRDAVGWTRCRTVAWTFVLFTRPIHRG
jgi:hypothetical protein